MIEGGIGYGTFENHFDDGALDGNRSTISTLAVFLGGGVRFTVWEDFSLAPTFGVVYAHSDNDFDARNDVGRQVLQLAGVNDIVNWSADTFTVVPGIEARYRHLFGGIIQLTLRSLFKYFHTEPISRSTTALSFESTSQWWLNEIDVEWRMPVYLWGRQLRTGAYINRSELYGGLETTLKTEPLLQRRRPGRDGRPGAAVAPRVHRHRGRVLLGRQVLRLDARRRDQLLVLMRERPRTEQPPRPRSTGREAMTRRKRWRTRQLAPFRAPRPRSIMAAGSGSPRSARTRRSAHEADATGSGLGGCGRGRGKCCGSRACWWRGRASARAGARAR